MRRSILAIVAIAALSPCAGADEPYMDDRSDAANLVRSLYNAVNRHEYARAYDYFTAPPAKSFDAYVQGYEGTASVDVITGRVTSDGAAGSVFYAVPTAVRARDGAGKTSYFAGCYTVRAVNGTVQDPPNRPLRIESAKLKVSTEADYTFFGLPDCGNGAEEGNEATPDAATLLNQARQRFASEMAFACDKVAETLGGTNEPEVYPLTYKPDYAGADEPAQTFTLFAFTCSVAAYNVSNVFYGHEPVSGLQRLSFASPHLALTYEDQEQTKLTSIAVDGFASDSILTNAEFDPATGTINHYAKWRGIGDAASHGEYVFREGQFVLKEYDVDPTTDEQMNPYLLVKDGKMVAKPELIPDG